MLEMPYAGKDHRQIVLICGGDYFLIAHGAAGLYHCHNAMLCGLVNPVAKREECIGRHHRSTRLLASPLISGDRLEPATFSR